MKRYPLKWRTARTAFAVTLTGALGLAPSVAATAEAAQTTAPGADHWAQYQRAKPQPCAQPLWHLPALVARLRDDHACHASGFDCARFGHIVALRRSREHYLRVHPPTGCSLF